MRRQVFHSGTYEGRILGDDNFSEKALAKADEKLKDRYSLQQLIDTVCSIYGVKPEILAEAGKKQPGAGARAVVAYLVQEEESLSLTKLSNMSIEIFQHLAGLRGGYANELKSHLDFPTS